MYIYVNIYTFVKNRYNLRYICCAVLRTTRKQLFNMMPGRLSMIVCFNTNLSTRVHFWQDGCARIVLDPFHEIGVFLT